MIVGIVIGVAACVAVYLDRSNLKGKVVAAEGKVSNVESAVKGKIKEQVAGIVADVKAWDEKAKEGSASAIAQLEARLKQILA